MTNLNDLRRANVARQAEWPGREHVDLAFRGLEMAGEAGELANKLKKLVRLQRGIHGTNEERAKLMQEIADEMADVVICVDLIGMEIGIDSAEAVRSKFNATSAKHGLKTRL